MTDGWVTGIQNSRDLTSQLCRDYTTHFMLGIILPSCLGINYNKALVLRISMNQVVFNGMS